MNDGIVGVNHAPLFDPAAYTTAGQPHLIEHLWGKYRAHLQELIDERKKTKPDTVTVDEALKRATAAHFMAFCTQYLSVNRPVTNFFVDMNHGLVLSNTARVVVSPGFDLRGTMQSAGAVGVTAGVSQPGMNGVAGQHGEIGII